MVQLETGKWRISREHTLSGSKVIPPGWRTERSGQNEVGEVGMGLAFQSKESAFYAKGNEASKQQSVRIRCVFKKKLYSSCRREETEDMERMRLKGTRNHGSYADWT